MPIYEFKCNRCGNIFEQLTFPSDEEDKVSCPSCGERNASRLMSLFSCGSTSSVKDLSSGPPSGCSSAPGGFT